MLLMLQLVCFHCHAEALDLSCVSLSHMLTRLSRYKLKGNELEILGMQADINNTSAYFHLQLLKMR